MTRDGDIVRSQVKTWAAVRPRSRRSVRARTLDLKIDVLASVLRNEARFDRSHTVVVTGERAEESVARCNYKETEVHRADARDGRAGRRITHARPVHKWTETQVWDALRRHGVTPHPAYQLGWGRLSCRSCIFGSPDQWATIRALYPLAFERLARKEEGTGLTIQRKLSIREMAAKGRPYPAALERPELALFAGQPHWDGRAILVRPEDWTLPAGAFGESAGPT